MRALSVPGSVPTIRRVRDAGSQVPLTLSVSVFRMENRHLDPEIWVTEMSGNIDMVV